MERLLENSLKFWLMNSFVILKSAPVLFVQQAVL